MPYTHRSTLYLMTAVARYLRGLFFLAMIMFVCFHDNSMHLLAERLIFRLRVQLLGIHPPATHTPVFAWQFLLCAVRVPSRLLVCRQSLGKVRRGPRQDMKPKIAELHRVHTKKDKKKRKARDESRFDLRGVHAHLTAGSARADIKWRRCCCSLPASLLS